jgi:hypothetical protein
MDQYNLVSQRVKKSSIYYLHSQHSHSLVALIEKPEDVIFGG